VERRNFLLIITIHHVPQFVQSLKNHQTHLHFSLFNILIIVPHHVVPIYTWESNWKSPFFFKIYSMSDFIQCCVRCCYTSVLFVPCQLLTSIILRTRDTCIYVGAGMGSHVKREMNQTRLIRISQWRSSTNKFVCECWCWLRKLKMKVIGHHLFVMYTVK